MKININATNSGTVTFPARFGMSLSELKASLMKDPEFREEYYKPNDIGAELAVIRKIKGITQKELAEKIGTKQPAIARAEQWGRWASLRTLHKMARALGYYLKIEIKRG